MKEDATDAFFDSQPATPFPDTSRIADLRNPFPMDAASRCRERTARFYPTCFYHNTDRIVT